MAHSPPIPPSFQTLKSRILSSLSTPASTYTDASPKGSLDTAIVPLIERLNALEGIVTTSSCAGRVSVFLVGRRGSSGGRVDTSRGGGDVGECENHEDNGRRMKMKKGVPGGKGLGGRWLFVSHDPLELPKDQNGRDDEAPLTKMFGLTRDLTENENMNGEILHIATASLTHAAPVLGAAISAGFRESGVQSLKNLTDPNAVPMVAVRSAGVAFESIIGCVHDGSALPANYSGGELDRHQQDEEVIEALVDEEYLMTLVGIANERFEVNTERIRRFQDILFRDVDKKRLDDWEDKETRQERKKVEGLRRREELKVNRNSPGSFDGDAEDGGIEQGSFEGIT
ncbi:MAG: hypothetical protein Q9172_001864 [Xanthocarpia lactea]